MTTEHHRWHAMGCDAHVVAVDADASVCAEAVRYSVERVEQLEARWSRFRPSSEISRLNATRDAPVIVSADTYRLAELAFVAHQRTGGRFDPTVVDAMCALGYDRSFEAVLAAPTAPRVIGAPGADGWTLDPTLRSIWLGTGVGFDAGGIGKGLAADIVVEELRAFGVEGAMVNIGGDIAIDGEPPDENGWIVGIEDPWDPTRVIGRVTIERGGVCTSSRVKRAWRAHERQVHHLLDPHTGVPLDTATASITVVAGAAWWAEAVSKALFVGNGATRASYAQLPGDVYDLIFAASIDDNGEVMLAGDDADRVFDFTRDAPLASANAH